MRHYIRLLAIALLGVISGCEPYDQMLLGSGAPNYGGYNNNGNYPYNNYNSRYPSNGYETEYRKAQQQINSANSQAIVSGISQRMLNGGWYPEGMAGNQLVFTRERNSHDQDIYYKTVYTLVPSSSGYKVYANMKLKTVGSPYGGSLDDAARNVDDRTESILKTVKREVEQQSISAITPVPTPIPVTKKPYSNSQKKQHYYDQPRSTSLEQTAVPVQTTVKSEVNSSSEQAYDTTSVPVAVETNDAYQQEQTQQTVEQHQTKQQIKKERMEKAKERKKQSAETKAETHEQEDHSNDQQPMQDENTVTKEPEASQQ